MKRSDKEGRWGDIPSARVRFACEAGFLVAVAVLAAIAELRPVTIIVVMAVAWLLVAVIERASSHAARAATAEVEEAELAPEVSAAAVPLSVSQTREAYRWLFWRRERAAAEELTSPTAALEERPARSHVRRIEPEPERAQEPPAQVPELLPAGPAVTSRPLELSGLEEPPAPQAAPSRARRLVQSRRAASPPAPTPSPPAAQEWNIWDLEKRAREQAGTGPRDEEWSALFTHLRAYASADGNLPKEFDGLVRESFGELIEAA